MHCPHNLGDGNALILHAIFCSMNWMLGLLGGGGNTPAVHAVFKVV